MHFLSASEYYLDTKGFKVINNYDIENYGFHTFKTPCIDFQNTKEITNVNVNSNHEQM